jgi:hypothetical protein
VSTFGDDGSEMTPIWLMDDDTVEAIVAGDEVDARFAPLTAFAHNVRALGDEPVPTASPALEDLFARGAAPGRSGQRRPRMLAQGLVTAAAKLAALGVAAKVGLGVSVAAASVAGAGAAGALPDPANDRVRGAIEAVTPVDFDDPADSDDPTRFGDRVSSDATGESDDDNGVDGRGISDEAPGASHRPTDPGSSNQSNPSDATGLDRADETPAAPHLPDDVPPPTSTSDEPPSTPPSTVPPPVATVPSTVPPHGNDTGE